MKMLQFSGGLDSLAALWVLKPVWPELTLLWVDSGAAYPETRELVQRIRDDLPLKSVFTTVGQQPEWIKTHGYPSDVLPINHTHLGNAIRSFKGVMFQPWITCCNANLWAPGERAVVELGATDVYRGQRNNDRVKSPIIDGTVIDGVTYHFPLAQWTRERVRACVEKNLPEYFPAYYRAGEDSSHDCWDCTAHLEDNAVRINALEPERRAVVHGRLRDLLSAVTQDEKLIHAALGDATH
jgi:phosphoadenosine phosphosulfate reductase